MARLWMTEDKKPCLLDGKMVYADRPTCSLTRVSISRYIEFQTYDTTSQPDPQDVKIQITGGDAKIRGAYGHADSVTVQTHVVHGLNPRVSCDISYWFNVASPPFFEVGTGVTLDGITGILARGSTLVDDITIGVQNLGYGFVRCGCNGTVGFDQTPIPQGLSYTKQFHASDIYSVRTSGVYTKDVTLNFTFRTELSS